MTDEVRLYMAAALEARGYFPEGDNTLVRTIVYDHPFGKDTQILVSVYTDGAIEVAERPAHGATWGAPWKRVEEESW
jgi:hypothetical protein